MLELIRSLALFAGLMLAVQVISCILVAWRCRSRRAPALADRPGVTLIRPVCGLDHGAEETLASTFRLDWPALEILFCVADPRDPAVHLLDRLCRDHPGVEARILVGRDSFPFNPKLDNCAKGYRTARYDWVVMSDSNLLLPPDYLQRVIGSAGPGVGVVSAPPLGGDPRGFWAEVECTVLNSFQARVQYTVDAAGAAFAQGKTLAFRRSVLAQAGGYAALGAEPAEDAAATLAMRRIGLRIRLVRPPFVQPLGRRTAAAVWQRQVRWARLRRASFPVLYAPEILAGSVIPAGAAIAAAVLSGADVLPLVVAYLGAWYAAEAALALSLGWRFVPASLAAMLVRDLALPANYVAGWAGRSFAWRGNSLSVTPPAKDDGVLSQG